MDLKRCRAQSKNKSLVNSSATYIKLLDYAERLEKELETINAVCDARGEKIRDLFDLIGWRDMELIELNATIVNNNRVKWVNRVTRVIR